MPRSQKHGLQVLDRLHPPELWPEVERRVIEISAMGMAVEPTGYSLASGRRRLLAVVVAVVVAVGGIGLAVVAFSGSIRQPASQGDLTQIVLSAAPGTDGELLLAAEKDIAARLSGASVPADTSIQGDSIIVSVPADLMQGTGGQDLLQLVSTTGRFELREVYQVLVPSDPDFGSLQLTCSPGDTPCEGAAVQNGQAVFLGHGDKYELGPTMVTNDAIARAEVGQLTSVTGGWAVNLTLTPAGKGQLAESTAGLVSQQVAFILDEEVLSAPTVQSQITDGTVQIVGDFTQTQAIDLASILNVGPLPVSLSVTSVLGSPSGEVTGGQ